MKKTVNMIENVKKETEKEEKLKESRPIVKPMD